MGTRWILCLSLLAPLAAAPALANSSPAPDPAPIAKSKTPATTPTTSKTDKSAPGKSKERIYTYKPRPEADRAGVAPSAQRVIVASSDIPFLGFSPIDNSVMGVGLWRVPKVNRNDPNRGSPLRDRRGRTSRAAAVGFQLAF